MDNIVIRIFFTNDHQVDWHISSPNCISFQDVLDVIWQTTEDKVMVSSFEYEDEDGDRITVKSDEELRAMMHFHVSGLSLHDNNCFISASDADKNHINIYPKVCKHQRRRNLHDLKVSITPTASSVLRSENARKNDQFSHNPSGPDNSARNNSALSQEPYPEPEQQNADVLKDSLTFEIGKFNKEVLQFLETLGNGNSGIVRRAIHKPTGLVTAVKSITLDLTGDEQKQIALELEILHKCNGSPYIIAFYGAFFNENQILLCTEYMDGGSLDKFGAIPSIVLRNVASAIAFGLSHLWSLRIMHRDVKPSNVLVNTSGQIKLCDFGVSTQLVNSIARTYIGTNAYMSPERVVGEEYTVFSDIWSFGLSLCELALGRFPYPQLAPKIAGTKGIVPIEVMQCIVNEAAPRLPHGMHPEDLSNFVACCLQKQADRRPLPEQLCHHPLILNNRQTNEENNNAIVSSWLSTKLH